MCVNNIRLKKLGRLMEASAFIDAQHTSMESVLKGSCHNKEYILSNLRYASREIGDGNVLPKELGEFISNALLEISLGADANVAFQLKNKNKRKAEKTKEINITIFVLWMIEAHSLKVAEAFERVGLHPRVNLSFERVKKIYYKHKNLVENQVDEMLS